MWILSKSFRFEAAHSLPDHDGLCRIVHGHSYTLTVHLASQVIWKTGPKRGMVYDFGDIVRQIKPFIDRDLDHRQLNELENSLFYPTAENLAHSIYREFKELIPHLVGVTIEETATSRCTYISDAKLTMLGLFV